MPSSLWGLALCRRVRFEELCLEYIKNPNQSAEPPGLRWWLIFRASSDGFGCPTFHRLCDDLGPTVTVARLSSADNRFQTPHETGDGNEATYLV